MKPLDLSVYLVTDRALTGGRPLEQIVEQAVQGGVTLVQLREKDCTTREFVELAVRVKRLLAPFHVPLIINDRVDVALAAESDGVHVGQDDMSCEMVRRLVGPNMLVGLSVETLEQARAANELDIDYIGLSPVFATATKTDTSAPLGLEGVRQIAAISCHPTVAIGGINATNAAAVLQAGADGLAVVTAISMADDPQQAARTLKQLCDHHDKKL